MRFLLLLPILSSAANNGVRLKTTHAPFSLEANLSKQTLTSSPPPPPYCSGLQTTLPLPYIKTLGKILRILHPAVVYILD